MEKWVRERFLPNLPLGEGGARVTASREHIKTSREAAIEGMVLLKNDGGVLPLAKGAKIALFGKGTFDYVKGGGGSGDVHVPYVKNLYDGLSAYPEEVTIFPGTAQFYQKYVSEAYRQGGIPGMIREPQLPDELLSEAADFADTAVLSISRFSGEAWDRGSSMGQPGTYACDDQATIDLENELFARGDFYLTDAERTLVDQVLSAFRKVVIVLNVGGVVDSSWFADEPRISSVFLAWQGGMEGGTAEAELILGHRNFSGKLADTFAASLEDYPSTAGFHEAGDHVDYTEDIYVGYRYFETLPGKAVRVNYPFGFGLSYTDFAISPEGAECAVVPTGAEDPDAPKEKDVITVRLAVMNIGDYPGREVVQLYYGAPQGQLGKPARQLIRYHKTALLPPGGSEEITFTLDASELSSYDDIGRIQKSSWVLERGDYSFYLGTDVRSAKKLSFTYHLDQDVVTERLVSRMAPTQLSMRLRADGSFESLPLGEPHDPNADGLQHLTDEEIEGREPGVRARDPWYRFGPKMQTVITLQDVADGKASLDDFLAQLSDEDLCWLVGGQPNAGVSNTNGIGNLPAYGVPNVLTADGPAGVRIDPQTRIRTTAFPCATLLACTFDPEICYQVGRAGAEEVKENNLSIWLTPAVNIHRSPLCGRNFEYYSEDPYLAGTQAAAMVRGIQSLHVGACVKHLCCNNKETNRKNSDSRVSERAIREIYLKQFEIIVKTAHPWMIMTSYNEINGWRASENRSLLDGIVRQEWGFDGCFSTDWWNYAEEYQEINAGNDLRMPSGYPDRLMSALEKGLLTRGRLERAARNILSLILKLD
ncbi:MAG: glycoside hydrolase family 3 C-terminal domain-containing protein [Lachnospiraceae bacterium]